MQRVTVSRNCPLRLPVFADHLDNRVLMIRGAGAALGNFREETTRGFRGSEDNRATAEYPCRDSSP
jgi:hypothetical protein